MEREGEVGREMRKGRRGIVIGGMVLGLLMGCNNGIAEELTAEKRLGEIGRSAEGVFYKFIELVTDSLGFSVDAETTKQKVGEHFTALGTKIGEASAELDKVAEKAAEDSSDKDGLLSKTIKEAVEAAKNTLSALKTNVDLLGTVGDGDKVGEAVNDYNFGRGVADNGLEEAYNALKGIVGIAKGMSVPEPKLGNKAAVKVGSLDNKDGAKILATSSDKPAAGATDTGKAAAIIASVSGEEILASIVSLEKGSIKEVTSASETTTPLEFAKGGTATNLSNQNAKAAAVAGGIALRSLVKEGKLATGAAAKNPGGQEEVQAVGRDAVNKLLIAVEDIIKKTVKETLKKAKEKIDEARASKATAQK